MHSSPEVLVNWHSATYACSFSFPSNQKQALLKWLFGIIVNIWSGKGVWLTHLLDTTETSPSFCLLMPNLLNEWCLIIASISYQLMISFTTSMRLLVEMASDDPFICTSTVLSWSSVFLMVWYTEHIWLLPLSQHCSSGIKFIVLLLFCFLFWFIFFPL